MAKPLESSIVRIRNHSGRIFGAGFLVTDRHVITCAHVVSQVLGLSNSILELPQGEVYLDFPLVAPNTILIAQIILWLPEHNEGADIAGLELIDALPSNVQPVKLIEADDLWEHPFGTFGFPIDHDDGIWASGVLRGRQATGWIQIEAEKVPGYSVAIGFSGAPVWDQQLNGVIGMVVAAETQHETKAAFVIPTDILVENWPQRDDLPRLLVRTPQPHREESSGSGFEISTGKPDYPEYLRRVISNLQEWEIRYAPLFARFRHLTLFAQTDYQRNNPEPLLDVIKRNKKIVMLGVAGTGKTTTLQRIALEAAQRSLKNEFSSQIPIVVSLRDYGPPTIEALIAAKFGAWGTNFKDIETDLVAGKFFLIFDGVNEVTEAKRDECCKELRHLTERFPNNRYIFTARSVGYSPDCLAVNEKNLPICTILPLTRGQIEDYICRYFDSSEADMAVKLIDDLSLQDDEAWNNPAALVHLAKVPLLLQMLILTFEAQQHIPRNEGELLLRFVDSILIEREPGKRAGSFGPDLKKSLLAAVAWKMHTQGLVSAGPKRLAWEAFSKRLQELQNTRQVSSAYIVDDIWQEIQNNHLLIVEGERVFWPHPLFQDLFVGLELHGLCFDLVWTPRNEEIAFRFSPLQAKWFGDSSFDIGITMLETMPPEARVQALVAISCYNPPLVWQAYLHMEPEYHPELARELLTALKQASLSEEYSGDQHRNLIKVIGHFNDPSVKNPALLNIAAQCPTWEGRDQSLWEIWRENETNVDRSIITFTQTISETDREDQVRITGLSFLIRVAATDEELILFLVERLIVDNARVAKHLQQVMGPLRLSPVVLNRLAQVTKSRNMNLAYRRQAIWTLGESGTGNISVGNLLRNIAKKEESTELRREAVKALRHFPLETTVKTLSHTIQDSNWLIRLESIYSLFACSNFNIVPALISALGDAEDPVGTAAIETLVAVGWKRTTIDALAEAAHTDNILIRRRAIKALADLAGNDEEKIANKAAKELQSCIGERDKEALLEVALGLRKYDLQTSTNLLERLLEDSSEALRELVIERCEEMRILRFE